MAISIKRYVDITSGVGAGASVRQRELITRVFTVNPLVPTGSHIEFTTVDDVASYFGSTSEEYARAAFYFGWVSKNIRRAKKISFARWTNTDTAPQIYGCKGPQALSAWQTITNGSLILTMGGDAVTLSGLNFSAAASLTAVAGTLQTAIRAAKSLPLWTAATVTFDPTYQRFLLVGGATGPASIAVAAGPSNDVASLIGWLTGAILSNGAAAETITQTVSTSAQADNNFGSFLFSDSAALTQAQVIEAATWNDAQNCMYQYHHRVTRANAVTWSAALIGFSGVGLTLASPVPGEYPEMVPGMILAATNYTARNSTQNYMFQQFGLTPSVLTNGDADIYDPLRVNYYGRTQTAGQTIDFYQRGVLMGGSADPVDMNIYANEQWLKDAMAAQIMTLLLAMAKISANSTGRGQLLAILHSVVNTGLLNGTISVGKTLSVVQQVYITEQTGDDKAWQQVQQVGYWLGVDMQSSTTTDGRVEWKAVYTLIYAKDDTVRAVDGTHVLI